jgi:hypothetical protein
MPVSPVEMGLRKSFQIVSDSILVSLSVGIREDANLVLFKNRPNQERLYDGGVFSAYGMISTPYQYNSVSGGGRRRSRMITGHRLISKGWRKRTKSKRRHLPKSNQLMAKLGRRLIKKRFLKLARNLTSYGKRIRLQTGSKNCP